MLKKKGRIGRTGRSKDGTGASGDGKKFNANSVLRSGRRINSISSHLDNLDDCYMFIGSLIMLIIITC